MKKIFVVLLVFALMLLPQAGLSAGSQSWETGDTWSYKWTYDYEGHEDDIRSSFESGSTDMNYSIDELSGGFVAMFTIEYRGKDAGYHKFDYEGGYYAEAVIDISIEASSSTSTYGSGSSDTRMEMKKLEVDFSGSLWVEKQDYQTHTGTSTAYAVVKQTIESKGEIKIEADVDMEMDSGETTMDLESVTDLNWNLAMDEINYDPGLPWVPPSTEGMSSLPSDVTVQADYTGSVEGHAKMETTGSSQGWGNMSLDSSIDEDVSETISNTESMPVTMYNRQGDEVQKPSPVMGCINIGSTALTEQTEDDSGSYYTSGILQQTIGESTTAEYDGEEGFYTTYYMGWMGAASTPVGTSTSYMPSSGSAQSISSQSASDQEVNSFMSDKESYTSDQIGLPGDASSEGLPGWLWWGLIPAVAMIAVIVLVLVMRKRKQEKEQPYASGQVGQPRSYGQEPKRGYGQGRNSQQVGQSPPSREDQTRHVCPRCGRRLRYIEEYDRWYCDSCQEYE